MKKFFTCCAVIMGTLFSLLILYIILVLSSCSNATDTGEYNGFDYAYKGSEGFVYRYMWDGTPETMDIYIPDEVQGRRITAIGGYLGRGLPLPFAIDVPFKDDEGNDIVWPSDYYSPYMVEDTEKKYNEYETYKFTVHLGKNISSFKALSYDSYYAIKKGDSDNLIEKIYFKVEYKYVVDPENQYIESIDGKLSYK